MGEGLKFIINYKKSFAFLCYLMLFISGGGIFFKINRNLSTLILGVFIVLLIVLIQRRVKTSFLLTALVIFLCLSAYLILNFRLGYGNQDFNKYVFFIITLLIATLFTLNTFGTYTKSEFLEVIRKVLIVLMIHAVLSAIFLLLLPFPQLVYDPNTDYVAKTFFYIFYINTDQYSFSLLGIPIFRNQGIFWEPGVLQFYLNLLLYIQLFLKRSKDGITVLTVIAILTTYSTTGYLLLTVQLLFYFWENIKKSPLIIPILIGVMALLFPLLIQNLVNKFTGDYAMSGTVRLYDTVQMVSIIFDNPIFGVGLDEEVFSKMRGEYSVFLFEALIGQFEGAERIGANSISFLMATLGLPVGLLLLTGYIKMPFFNGGNAVVLSIILLISVATEPILFRPLFLFFIVSGLLSIYYNMKKSSKESIWNFKIS